MLCLNKRCFFPLIGIAALSLWSAPAFAEIDYYKCLSESGTVFGENFAFGYDGLRNTILIQDHREAAYRPDFTLGNVTSQDGVLAFDFEYWADGTVAIRDSHTLDLESLNLSLKQDFYAEDGSLYEHGQTALGACTRLNEANEPVINTRSDPTTLPVEPGLPATTTPNASANPTLSCHTEGFEAGDARSGTWCVISVLAEEKENSYGPVHLIRDDGAWCEGEPGYGIGVGIELHFEPLGDGMPQPAFDRLLIANGYDKSSRTFLENSRVKHIEIMWDDGETLVRTLKDETGLQEVLLGREINPLGLLVTILDVYPGQKYEDTCLSFLNADFGF